MENRLVDRMVGGFVMYVHQKVSLIFFISQGKEVERYPAEVWVYLHMRCAMSGLQGFTIQIIHADLQWFNMIYIDLLGLGMDLHRSLLHSQA